LAELETERLKARALTAALKEAQAEATREREAATRAAEAAQSRQLADTEALTTAARPSGNRSCDRRTTP
jgi:hypothetical protein